VWPAIFRTRQLSARHRDLLVSVIKTCERERDGFAFQELRWLHEVAGEAGLTVSPGDGIGFYKATTDNHLAEGVALSGGIQIRPTYAGIVRATMKETSDLERLVADLEAKWEVPNVDFKRELTLATAEQKGEFVKDMIAIATTQLDARRFYLIGWDPKTRKFLPPGVDPKLTEEQMQQILGSYCDPPPHLRYQTLPFHGSLAGIIEVERNPTCVPYRVSRDIGKLKAGQTFVRHGTVTEPPTPAEEAALKEEAHRARSGGSTEGADGTT
jgi:hypothetical protein